MSALAIAAIVLFATLLGFFFGRWFERTHITYDLLASRDPGDWSSAHRIVRGRRSARFNSPGTDEDSDAYPPTPSRPFPALKEKPSAAMAPTVIAGRQNDGKRPQPGKGKAGP